MLNIRLFQLAIFCLPINSLDSLPVFGFLGSDLSFYIFILIILLSLPSFLGLGETRAPISKQVKLMVTLLIISITLSFFFNFEIITNTELKGRSGTHKHFNSLLVFIFGISVMMSTHVVATDRLFRISYLYKPILIGVVLTVLVAVIEVIAWDSASAFQILEFIMTIFGEGNFGLIPGRLSSITREPSVLGMYLSFACIWLYYFATVASIKSTKRSSFLLIIICLSIIWIAEARTGLAVLAVMFFGWAILRKLSFWSNGLMPKLVLSFLGLVLVISGVVLMAIDGVSVDFIVSRVLDSGNISNVSRYSTAIAASSVFLENPILGTGFGQYAFSGIDHLPEWAWVSWDVRRSFLDIDSPWPQVYSTPARIAAELGLLGLLAWYGSLFWLVFTLLSKVKSERSRLYNAQPIFGVILIFGLLYVIGGGLIQGSFRHFTMWIMLGFCSAYLSLKRPEHRYNPWIY